VFAPDKSIVPDPSFVMPKVEPLITPDIVKSVAEVPSSTTVIVLVAPKATGQAISAPSVPVVASVTLMFPARVNVPDPVIAEPVTAPHSKFNEVGEPIVLLPISKVAPLLTDKDPPTVKLADNVVVPIESFKLLKDVKGEPGSVFVAVNTTVPLPLVKTFEPELASEKPLHTSVPPLVITIEPIRLLFPLFPKETVPETTSLVFALKERAAVPLLVGDKLNEAQTAFVTLTTTDWPPVMVTASELVGNVLLFQLAASPQLVVLAPPSQVFWA